MSESCYIKIFVSVLHIIMLLCRNYDRSLKLLQRATAMPAKRAAYHDKSEPVQNRLYRSLRVWSMYADLEESLGSFEVSCWLVLFCQDTVLELYVCTMEGLSFSKQ